MRVAIFSLAYSPFVGGAEIAVKEITDRLPSHDLVVSSLNHFFFCLIEKLQRFLFSPFSAKNYQIDG